MEEGGILESPPQTPVGGLPRPAVAAFQNPMRPVFVLDPAPACLTRPRGDAKAAPAAPSVDVAADEEEEN